MHGIKGFKEKTLLLALQLYLNNKNYNISNLHFIISVEVKVTYCILKLTANITLHINFSENNAAYQQKYINVIMLARCRPQNLTGSTLSPSKCHTAYKILSTEKLKWELEIPKSAVTFRQPLNLSNIKPCIQQDFMVVYV
jgi:hypothetical protein